MARFFVAKFSWSGLDVHKCDNMSAVYSPATAGRKQILSTEISLGLFFFFDRYSLWENKLFNLPDTELLRTGG